ncbi:hypothetical protein M9H77_24707 [Catharanthus roseus]|uniref:Uncharacterized protein n=1 Tax=Catharanthus roseus TaxID=4058 RepID=A0ACC0A532_CATRO|nr:hypothetical protein M9H77_24707 [Catharanthus roseus]
MDISSWVFDLRPMGHREISGESLSSISKLYGVPLSDIAAANEEMVGIGLVFEGQQLNIPSSITSRMQKKGRREMIQPLESSFQRASSFGLYRRFLNLKNSTLPSFPCLYHQPQQSCKCDYQAKTTGYFLLLVPLIAFCIRCIMGALNNRFGGKLDHNSANESERHQNKSKKMRWETALLDLRDPDESDTNPRLDFDHFIEDEDHIDSNDLSHNYSKLEEDYQKFLSECGMSKWGYWRGGFSK